ncbi:MAG: translation initiation factor IF-2 subunit gamma [Nanoarchaeota archaeon]|nr:translation initiation factor IF-2 subunit gamma [Nanoarchaeota archaeon]
MAKKKETEKIEKVDESTDAKVKSVKEKKQKPKTTATAAKKKDFVLEEASGNEIESSQPEVSIGFVGHVDHGKTTLTEKLSGKWTDTHSEEIKRGITIRLGYADAVIYKCPNCEEPECYCAKKECPKCGAAAVPQRKVSFIDAPGHESLMATMLSGANIMDGALLLVAANEFCPQPQTREHLTALEIVGIKKIIVVQNKIDLVPKEQAQRSYQQIKSFLKGTSYENAPIIPISAQHTINIDALIMAIQKQIPTPERDNTKTPIMFVARSFDINKPGSSPEKIVGGVLGGSLKQGILKVGDEIEIKPGREIEEKNRKVWIPIKTKIVSAITGNVKVNQIHPGGSVGILTQLDPGIVKADTLSGAIVGLPGKLPEIWYELTMQPHLLKRVVGSDKELDVEPIKLGEPLMLNVNSSATVGIVDSLGKNKFHCKLKIPVCADIGARVTISRRVGTRFRLIGYGFIKEK